LTSRFIGSRSKLFANKLVLELGCGLGLCGIVAGILTSDSIVLVSVILLNCTVLLLTFRLLFMTILSAHAVGSEGFVLLTDRDSEVLDIAAKNVLRNEVNQRTSTTQLAWDDNVTAERILEEYSAKNNRNRKGFDVIIGSDCLYSGMTAVRQLFSTVAHMLYDDSDDCLQVDEKEEGREVEEERKANRNESEDENDCDDIDSLPTSTNGGGWKYLRQHTQSHNTDINVPPTPTPTLTSSTTTPTPTSSTSVFTPSTITTAPLLAPHPVPIPVRSVFVLGYERRLGGAEVDMSAMFDYAAELGLEWCIAEDSVIDIFGNETSERTLFWEQCVLLFTRRKKIKTP
jgi:Lysine methyltransferase